MCSFHFCFLHHPQLVWHPSNKNYSTNYDINFSTLTQVQEEHLRGKKEFFHEGVGETIWNILRAQNRISVRQEAIFFFHGSDISEVSEHIQNLTVVKTSLSASRRNCPSKDNIFTWISIFSSTSCLCLMITQAKCVGQCNHQSVLQT